MTTPEKCEAILREILRRCNKSEPGAGEMAVGFSEDWGGNALTLHMDGSHTHVGFHEATFDQLIEGIHKRLVDDEGLSLAIPLEKAVRVNPEE